METSTFILLAIGFITLFGVVCHFQVMFTFKNWQQELEKLDQTQSTTSSVRWINNIINEYQSYKQLQHEPINTISLVEKHFLKERIRLFGVLSTPVGNVLKLQSLLPMTAIICGILGTFIGLTIAMFSMQEILATISSPTSDVTMNSIVSAISLPFQGMSLAFVTSIAGIGSSLLLNLFQTGFLSGGTSISYYKNSILAEAESLLDHSIASKVQNEKPKDLMEKILDRFSEKVQQAFENSVHAFGDKMVDLTSELKEVTTQVREMLRQQERATETFADTSDRLKEFSSELSVSIQSLQGVRSGIDSELQTLSKAVKGLEKQLQGSLEKQETGQRRFEQMLQRSDQLLKDSSTKTAEISQLFLKGLEDQMSRAYVKQEEMERRLYQKQEEMTYAFQDKHSQYNHAAQDFASSVHHLEKAWNEVVERLRRDMMDAKMEQSRIRQQPSMNNENRELIRAIEMMSERSTYDLNQIQQYLTELYQVLLRIVEQQQYVSNAPRRSQIPTRINE
ncbi:uncharacterized protein YoxC [Bacillus mesophilus]|uniref:MotA/TolQ/ExbB proton channel domain-containing protein n=1 Tax=Bacillus mesophilus TaxID=1808955 RepID=A0A6M0Q5S1_9BACI|nr:hypothetical protein [Bacillus mesophilus]MBM7660738.1 uncharacterized protein YoxC [Bacillus mesophilus]NEY71716.1 hypothetical protein [Bacillus mesophilus]